MNHVADAEVLPKRLERLLTDFVPVWYVFAMCHTHHFESIGVFLTLFKEPQE